MKTKLHRLITKTAILVILFSFFGTREIVASANDHSINYDKTTCGITKTHVGNCWTTQVVSVTPNNGKFDIQILVTYTGTSGCKELSHFSIEADDNSFSNVSWSPVSGNPTGNIELSLGKNDPFDGFKLDNVSGIGDGMAGSFTMNYTLDYLQDQDFLAKAGNDYTQIASFTVADFTQVQNCSNTQCETADNQTATASITESDTKTLSGSPVGGTWSIVSGGGSINGNIYIPSNINTNTNVVIRYTIAADGSCVESTDDVTFTVTPICLTAANSTTTASITEGQTKTLVGSPAGGTWSIVSGGGSINGTTYTPDDINTNTNVVIRYTIAADGSCAESTADVTFTVTPICLTAVNSTTTASITEGQTKTLVGSPAGGTWSIVSGGGSINGTTYTPDDITEDTDVTIRYTIAADGSCAESTADVTFTVTEVCSVSKVHVGNCWTTEIVSVTPNNGKFDIQVLVTYTGDGSCKELSHFSIEADDNSFSNVSWSPVTGSPTGTIALSLGNNDPFDGFKLDNISGIGDGTAGSFTMTYTLDYLQDQQFLAKAGNDYTQIASFTTSEFNQVLNCDNNTNCVVANNQTATASITEGETKTLIGSPAGGTWSIVSGGGSINGSVYTPDNINSNTDVTIRYTITANGTCSETFDDVTFTVTSLLGSIGDRVWFDTDKDTNQDAGEPGLVGATVTLDPGTPNDPSDDVTTTTGADGLYLFDNLPAGEYTITVDVSTVTDGIPAGKTVADLVQNYDYDGLGTANKSTYNLGLGEHNREQDFGYVVTSGGTGCGGNCGGVESESLGDAITKIYVGRKKNSVPTEFVKDKSNRYDKKKLQGLQVYQGKGQTMLDMFPEELVPGDVSHVTSPTDILDYTIADEVLSVDFSLNGETKGVVLGIKTSDRVYNHTKASCDRLRGAEVLNVQTIHLNGHDFLMQALQQRNGAVEYAISFAVGKNNNDNFYDLQTNWYVNHYNKFNDMYNFQVWSTKPAYTEKLLKDILNNLKSYIPVNQNDNPAAPITYASKIYRDKSELVVQLRSTVTGVNAELEMVELYSETANNIKHRYTTVTTEKEQDVRINIADAYEYDGLVKVNGEIQDAFYHADGNWGLDFDKRYTQIKNYFVWNDFNRTYQDDELPINRNVELKATSDYDYLILYKSLLPGNISADYNEYGYLAFTAKGAGMIELGLLKASIQDWKEQYRVMVEFSEEEQTYYVPFEIFTSTASQEKINADDLTTITFNWLPTDSNSTELDLEISDVRFVKKAGNDGLTVEPIITYDNQYLAYPNPSEGHVTTLLFSEKAVDATVTLHDITGKIVYKRKISLQEGKNEIDLNFNVSPGIMLLNIATNEHNFGTTKMIFR